MRLILYIFFTVFICGCTNKVASTAEKPTAGWGSIQPIPLEGNCFADGVNLNLKNFTEISLKTITVKDVFHARLIGPFLSLSNQSSGKGQTIDLRNEIATHPENIMVSFRKSADRYYIYWRQSEANNIVDHGLFVISDKFNSVNSICSGRIGTYSPH